MLLGTIFASQESNGDLSCRNTLQQTLLLVFKNQNPLYFSEFKIESESILVETVTVPLTSADQRSAFDGVLVACTSHKYFELLSMTQGKKTHFNIVLLNTVVYGDNFGDPKDVKINEVLCSSDILTGEGRMGSDTSSSYHHYKKLKDFNVQLIFHRGDLGSVLTCYCEKENIYCISVVDYYVLFKIHQATRASIVFSIGNDLKETDVSRVCVYFHTMDRKITPNANNKKVSLQSPPTCGYVQVLNSQQSVSKQYSAIISGRGQDLMMLEHERFCDALNRVKSFLGNKQILKGSDTFEKSISDLIIDTVAPTEEDTCYEMTPWVRADVQLFWDLCKEHLEKDVFRRFNEICNHDNKSMTDVQFKTALWKDSFECVDRILTTVSLIENL